MVFVVLNPTKIVTLQVDALILVSDGVNLNLSGYRSLEARLPNSHMKKLSPSFTGARTGRT